MPPQVSASVNRHGERKALIRSAGDRREKTAPRYSGHADFRRIDLGEIPQKRMRADDAFDSVVDPLLLRRQSLVLEASPVVWPGPFVPWMFRRVALRAGNAAAVVHRYRRISAVVPQLDPCVEGRSVAAVHKHDARNLLLLRRAIGQRVVGEETRGLAVPRHILDPHGLNAVRGPFRDIPAPDSVRNREVHRLCARRERDRRRECASRHHDFPSHFAAPFTFASRRFSSSQRSGWL